MQAPQRGQIGDGLCRAWQRPPSGAKTRSWERLVTATRGSSRPERAEAAAAGPTTALRNRTTNKKNRSGLQRAADGRRRSPGSRGGAAHPRRTPRRSLRSLSSLSRCASAVASSPTSFATRLTRAPVIAGLRAASRSATSSCAARR